MDICCGRANCDSIEYILKMDNYEIIWKMDDEDWDKALKMAKEYIDINLS
jgi:hypothetical protein